MTETQPPDSEREDQRADFPDPAFDEPGEQGPVEGEQTDPDDLDAVGEDDEPAPA